MAQGNFARVEASEYQAIIKAFERAGAPVFSRAARHMTEYRRSRGLGNASNGYMKKAWEIGWPLGQLNGVKAPPIKTFFPQWVTEPEPPTTTSVAIISRPQPIVGAEGGIAPAPVDTSEPLIPAAMRQSDTGNTMEDVAARVEIGKVNALLNEMNILITARQNLKGIQELTAKLVAKLKEKAEGVINRAIADLETTDNVITLKRLTDTMREATEQLKIQALTFTEVQKAQRLLEGKPQEINERRTREDNPESVQMLGRLAALLRAPAPTGRAYGGEESAPAIDVEFSAAAPGAAPAESAASNGEGVAKVDAPTANRAES